MSDADFAPYAAGQRLYGDDFSSAQIEGWYRDEEHASFGIYDNVDTTQYDALNRVHGFSHLAGRHFERCVALGTADGKDIEPMAPLVGEFFAIEPEERWWRNQIGGRKTTYLKPSVEGRIPLDDNSADLSLAFSVLHHIPNVSFVISEIGRVLKPGAMGIFREPVVSMGDWRFPRPNMSPHERGIPPALFLKAIGDAGLEVVKLIPYDCPVVPRLSQKLGISKPYNNAFIVALDALLSSMLTWNMHYHARNTLQKIAPASYFLIVRKT